MTDRTPEQIRDEANRILDSEIFKEAVAAIRAEAMSQLLAATGPDADTTRREKADLINAINGVEARIRATAAAAAQALRPRGHVA